MCQFLHFCWVFVLAFLVVYSEPRKVINTAQCIKGINSPVVEWSPGFSHGKYPNNVIQTLIFISEPKTCMTLTFKVFDVERSPGCSGDFVSIHDGVSLDAPRVARACGLANLVTAMSPTYSTTRNGLTIMFRSDGGGFNGRGFEAQVTAVPCSKRLKRSREWENRLPIPKCIDSVGSRQITVSSPGFSTGAYSNNLHYSYLIISPSFTCIQFKLKTVEIEGSLKCSKDYLAVYDGLDPKATLQLLTCGTYYRFRQLPMPTYSSDNVIFLVFHSDSHSSGVGFEADVAAVSCRHSHNEGTTTLGPESHQIVHNARFERPACGKPYFEPTIKEDTDVGEVFLNSTVAFPHSWPWHASIRMRGAHICDGVLVSPLFVLSVAHCLKSFTEDPFLLEVWLGKHTGKDVFEAGKEQRLTPERIILNPGYNRFYDFEYDLALVRLKRPGARQSSAVQPICSPYLQSNFDFATKSGDMCFVTGFSKNGPLQQIPTKTISSAECVAADRNLSPFVLKNNGVICGRSAEGCLFCQGGAALACKKNHTWYLAGTLLYGYGWKRSLPTIFVKTSKHIHWIKRIAFDTL